MISKKHNNNRNNNNRRQKISTCVKIMATLATFLTLSAQQIHARPYRYYNTREYHHVKPSTQSQQHYTQSAINNAWIKVPWTHGGYYYHNTLTRQDQSTTPDCLTQK